MAYKEKTCPKCGTKHTKRGVFCSRSCGNQKNHTTEARKKIAETQTIRMNDAGDDAAQSSIYAYRQNTSNAVPEPVAPVKSNERISSNQFVQDGDLWTEV